MAKRLLRFARNDIQPLFMSLQVAAPLCGWCQEETETSALGGIAKASGLDDGVSACAKAIVKGKALGDATRTGSFLGRAQRRSNLGRATCEVRRSSEPRMDERNV
jgi:hypothetical protein